MIGLLTILSLFFNVSILFGNNPELTFKCWRFFSFLHFSDNSSWLLRHIGPTSHVYFSYIKFSGIVVLPVPAHRLWRHLPVHLKCWYFSSRTQTPWWRKDSSSLTLSPKSENWPAGLPLAKSVVPNLLEPVSRNALFSPARYPPLS